MTVADRQLSLRLDESRDSPIARRMRALGRKAKRAADKVTGEKPIEGFVDRVLAGEVQGWAFDPNKPGRRVHIIARHEGEIIAETLADLPRKDLSRGGKGDGKHGFNLRIPAAFLDGSPRRLRIEAASGRTRILLRRGEITLASSRPSAGARKSKSPPAAAGPSGALEGVANGVLLGWAVQPKSGGAPAVVDVYDDERYLGSVMADRPRPRRDDEPRGAKSFHFRLPDGADEAVLRRLRARIGGTQLDLRGLRAASESNPLADAEDTRGKVVAPASTVQIVARSRIALLLIGSDADETITRTMRSWSEQSLPSLEIGRITDYAGREGQNVFGPSDFARLRGFAASAGTMIVLRAGETLHPELARTLSLVDPLADVLTWDRDGVSQRRSEAWPLAIQLGQTLGGAYALRAPQLGTELDNLVRAALTGERALELAVAAAPLRWRHLPAALSGAPMGTAGMLHPSIDPPALASLTLAVWPTWSEAADRTLLATCAALPEASIEVLIPLDAPDALVERLRSDHGRVFPRRVDLPANADAGMSLRRLSEAATGEVVLSCHAGLSLETGADLQWMTRWALAPNVGAVTGSVATSIGVCNGLTVNRTRKGWRLAPAAAVAERAPILAAPAAFMAVSRAKCAAVGGVDAVRFPDEGADLDLCLRFRRLGWFSLAMADVRASAAEAILWGENYIPLALIDPAELAAAASCYPAADQRRTGQDA